jgi:hypothetical protein
MNKFQKAGLAVVAASGMAFAAGTFWGPSIDDFPSLQVRTDDVVACWQQNPPDPVTYGSPCYENAGGWWFGYTNSQSFTGGENVKIFRNGQWEDFSSNVSLTDADGNSVIGGAFQTRIEVTLGGDGDGAGIGFNHKQESNRWNGGNNLLDITGYNGYCLTYSLTGKAVQFVLGWDESAKDDPAYDAWYATIQPTEGGAVTVLDLPWEGSAFRQDGWATGRYPKTKALSEAVSVKIRVTKEGLSNLAIYQLGKLGDCTSSSPVPVLKNGSFANNLKMVQNGRVFSFSMERAASVQVINLQGAVVYTQTIANQTMNLSHLPTGVYMVRIPSLGYTNRVILK